MVYSSPKMVKAIKSNYSGSIKTFNKVTPRHIDDVENYVKKSQEAREKALSPKLKSS
jgi:hypothetical protein